MYEIYFVDGTYESWDDVSLVYNPGWVTCWNLDSVGARLNTPMRYSPRERIKYIEKKAE